MVQEIKKERVAWIDTARGIGILLIILGHLPGLGSLSSWIFSFHLPLFFFLSGYLFKNDISFFPFLGKKAKTLLLPYAVLSAGIIVYRTLFSLYEKTFSASSFLHLFLDFVIQRRAGTVWFLTCLFLLEVLFYFVSKYLKKYFLLAVMILVPIAGLLYIHFGGPALPWNFDVCFLAMPFFYIGYLFKQHPKGLQYILASKVKTMLVLVACLAINIGFCVLNCWRGKILLVDMYDSTYGIYPFMLLSALGGILATVFLSTMIQSNIITHIGANSLVYFGWHQQIFKPIAITLVSKVQPYFAYEQTWVSFLTFILILLMCGVVENIITRTKLRVLMGKF